MRLAIESGLPAITAYQCVSLNPARHMRLTPFVGSVAPGRYADLVMLGDTEKVSIAEVWADGVQVSTGARFTAKPPRIDWPDWATRTIKIQRSIEASDFAIHVTPGRATMNAALLRPFHWDDTIETKLAVENGEVQRREPQHHQIRRRRPLFRQGADLENVLAGLRPEDAGYRGGLHGGA
jgi:adenine deaminase